MPRCMEMRGGALRASSLATMATLAARHTAARASTTSAESAPRSPRSFLFTFALPVWGTTATTTSPIAPFLLLALLRYLCLWRTSEPGIFLRGLLVIFTVLLFFGLVFVLFLALLLFFFLLALVAAQMLDEDLETLLAG